MPQGKPYTLTIYDPNSPTGFGQGVRVNCRTADGNYTLLSSKLADAFGKVVIGDCVPGTSYYLVVYRPGDPPTRPLRLLWAADLVSTLAAFDWLRYGPLDPAPLPPTTEQVTFTVTKGSSGQGALQQVALAGATVAVKDDAGKVVYKATTPASGVLSPTLTLPNQSIANWSVRVNCPGYRPVTIDLTEIALLNNSLRVCLTPILVAGD